MVLDVLDVIEMVILHEWKSDGWRIYTRSNVTGLTVEKVLNKLWR